MEKGSEAMTWRRFIRAHRWQSAFNGICLSGMLGMLGDGLWTHQVALLAVGGIGSLFILGTFALLAALL